ncbi:TolC family protein [Dyadobacter sp. NIV53]|uniref:TolC family protein n=1 Tax=Dyadobacter sp. NIV53 TaxID=2861765 RepID=UPI001C86766D|nr:TolC family protein [Dyadobacter sp. NIV53]
MRIYIIGFLTFISTSLFAQDTLRLTIRQADSLFLKNNLQLLAERYQIDIAKSIEIQDKLWDNPNLSFELSAYNPSRGLFDVGRQGQKAVSIQQMITRAGKRNKQVALDVESTRKSEYQFFDLIRTLKFDLRQIFFETYFLNQTIRLLDTQIATLNTTVSAFEKEYNRNNISLKEVVRLKALLFQLTNDRADILFELSENQRDLKTYLNADLPVKPLVDSTDINRYQVKNYNPASLRDRAILSRTDLKIVQSSTKQAELNYTLQKALAVPNIQLGATYDQNSNYQSNYFGVSASVDLPFFNRNQGNIRAAKTNISYFKTEEKAKENSIGNEVDAALQKVTVAENAYKSVENHFTDQFELLNKGMYENFQKRNVTLLEFIDFIETYNESIKEFNRLQSDRIKVYEELNFVVGEELFN